MKKLLIIKTGTIRAVMRRKIGDFEDFICKQAEVAKEDTLVVPVYENALLPNTLEDISSIIITGSHAMVTDYNPWSSYAKEWILGAVGSNIPILGICYGHQLLADALGGTVNYHLKGEEHGNVQVQLTEEGENDKLLGILPSDFKAYAAHAQTVQKLPQGTVVLAKNNFEKYHALRFGTQIWGVQFHPEFTADISRTYIKESRERIAKQGYDVDKLLDTVQDNLYGRALLKRFIAL